MSALPPKADMCSATRHVCFVPIADIEEMSGCAATAGERVASRSAWVLQRSRHSTDWDCKTHDCPPAHSADIVLLSYIDSPNRHYLRLLGRPSSVYPSSTRAARFGGSTSPAR